MNEISRLKRLGLLFGLVIALVGCGQSEDEKFKLYLDSVYDWTMNEFPELATYQGYPGNNHRWTDMSDDARAKRQAKVKSMLAELEGFEPSKLNSDYQLDYQLLKLNLADQVEGFKFDGDLMPINQMGGVQQQTASMISLMRPTKASDYEDIIARIKGVETLVDQNIALMKQGLEKGVTPPKITLRNVANQIQAQIQSDPMKSPMLGAFHKMIPAVEGDRGAELKQAAVNAYQTKAKPAYEKLLKFWVEEYYPNTVEKTGISNLPNGKDWYALNARIRTTLTTTPDEIHEIGKSEVKRIRGEMEQIIKDTGFEGSFHDFFKFLQTDERFFHKTEEDLLVEYRDISKRADAELPALFGKLPRLPYGVTPIPDYAEKSQTTAYYQPGSQEAGRAGMFFANKYDLKSRPRWEMEALTLHEAMPGHHLQIALAQEQEGQHPIRRLNFITAFIEGWGLYSESLGEEMGFYKDPYNKFGQLTYEMWRAIRLVVDTGMHVKGWSRQQAIDFFKDNSPKAEHDITVEIDRYLVWPGQALAYKMGELKIKELRKMAEDTLGEKFDIRGFHDTVLMSGAVPLSVLEKQVKEWVETNKS